MKIVRTGTWMYDGTTPMPVDVIVLDYDWWYELGKADGTLDPGETPDPLGPEGCLYYVRFRRALEKELPTWVDSAGFATVSEAVDAADSKINADIKWQSVG